ncbi:alginate export family protein [Sedimenticola sp.]|uniref:alginate export family protein n=1 Tax=Sedimenticola sp. TaxID=1940285 RepID=UPI002589B283|nr:alginate export family protein [Sedimenticola sp.]MCW8902451.1 alginate export family protein [Sedimenticola sp.]
MSKFALARVGMISLLAPAGPSMAQEAGSFSAPVLTLRGQFRVRYDDFNNRQLVAGHPAQQGLLRGMLGADLLLNPNLRVYSEVGIGQADRRREDTPANFQNDGALQKLFVDLHREIGDATFGTLIGRHEFADGPRQLISVSDGPNQHRTWSGVRLYWQKPSMRLGTFDLRATRLEPGTFDKDIQHDERLHGVNASIDLASAQDVVLHLDPFWWHSHKPQDRFLYQPGSDERDTWCCVFGASKVHCSSTGRWPTRMATQVGRIQKPGDCLLSRICG